MTTIPTKEIEVFKKEVKAVISYATKLDVTDEKNYKNALEEGRAIQITLKKITARKEEITKPLNQALKSARELFKPIETMAEEAIDIIKGKMLAYQQEQTRIAEEQKQKLLDRVDRGTMKVDTAIRKINEDIATPAKTVEGENGSATVAMRKAYKVVDKSKVPLEFLEVDMAKVRAAFKMGKPVSGISEYEEADMRFTS